MSQEPSKPREFDLEFAKKYGRDLFGGAPDTIGQSYVIQAMRKQFDLDAEEFKKVECGYLETLGTLSDDYVFEIKKLESTNASLTRKLENVEKAVSEVRSWYPTDIFLEDGKSQDTLSAKMARKTCDNILNKLAELNGDK